MDLDVLLRFGFNILRGDILTAAKYGVWSYHHGDNEYYRGGPACFWEVYESNPRSGVILQVLTEELDAGKVLCKGLFATHPGWSYALNRPTPYWGASTFIIQKLRELHEFGWDHIENTALHSVPYLGRKKVYKIPSNWEMLSWLGPIAIRKVASRLTRRPMVEHWRLAIRSGSGFNLASTESGITPNMSGFEVVESPKGRFYADPFLTEYEGKPWLYFEDFDYTTELGKISCAEIIGGKLSNPITAIERPYHLSYPCLFRDGDHLYMIPETASNDTIELYRCIRFPNVWKLEKELFRGRAVDTAIWIDDGIYWFFVTIQEHRGFAMQLWLLSSESLTGKWKSHPSNPISTDVRNCRGADAIFSYMGKLYRPSQDCSGHYGSSFTLNEIIELSTESYRESPTVTVGAEWASGSVGTHTYAFTAGVEVVDFCSPLRASQVLLSR